MGLDQGAIWNPLGTWREHVPTPPFLQLQVIYMQVEPGPNILEIWWEHIGNRPPKKKKQNKKIILPNPRSHWLHEIIIYKQFCHHFQPGLNKNLKTHKGYG